MPIIRNNLNSRILIHLKGSKSIDLLEKNTVEITDDDLLSSHLQDLIQRGFVIKENEAKKEAERDIRKEETEGVSKEKEADEDLSKEKDCSKEAEEKSTPKKSSSSKKVK